MNEEIVRKILWLCGTALVTAICPAVAAFLAITLGDGHDKLQVIAFVVLVPLAFVISAWLMIRQARKHGAHWWAAAGIILPILMMVIGLA